MSGLLLEHDAVSRERSINDAKEIDVDDAAEIRKVAVAEFSNGGDRGVVKHEIEPTVICDGVADQRIDLSLVGNIKVRGFCASAALADFRSGLLSGFGIDVGHDDCARASSSQLRTDGPADASRAAGHDGD